MRISPNYKSSDWERLAFATEDDWQKAIDIFKDRLDGRFLKFIRQIKNDSFSGFAVMALDCLLIETLQQFYEGKNETPDRQCKSYFIKFLTNGAFKTFFNERMSKIFYSDIRNGLLHQAEVKGSSKISLKKSLPLVGFTKDNNGVIINRKLFHKYLLIEFEGYISRLANPEENKLRDNFRQKMNHICQIDHIM